MPISAPSDKVSGFTLIEMLVVLTVLGLVAALAAQTIGRRPAAVVRQEAQANLVAAIESARREAARTGAPRAVDPASLIEGASLSSRLPARAAAAGAAPAILVYPDGSSNGGTVSVRGRRIADIDWLTGEVRDAAPD